MQSHIAQWLRTRGVPAWLVAPRDGDERNISRAMLDGFGVGVVEGVRIFIPVLFTRLGADPLYVGLLSSMPAVAGLLLAVPIGMLISRSNNVIPWYAWSRLLLFLSYPLMAIMPLLFPDSVAIWMMVAIAALATLPQTSLTLVFNVTMGSIIDISRRYFLMSLRWSILGVCNGIAVYVAGRYLTAVPNISSYAIVIGIATTFTAFAFFPARKYEVPADRRDSTPAPTSLRVAFQNIAIYLRQYPAFRVFVICQAVFNAGILMSVPLFPLHWVRVLNADDSAIGTVSMIQSVTLLLGYQVGSYLATRFNARVRILHVCAIALGVYPLLTALVSSMAPLYILALIWGIATAGIELVLLDILLDSCPPGQITAVMPAYQLVMFMVTLIAPIVATAIARSAGTTVALIIAAGLHFLGAILFITLRVGIRPSTPDPSGVTVTS